jgi:hypothetical protein
MAILRNHDVFIKARADIQTKTTSGGLISILATVTAFILLLGQIYVYIFPQSIHTLHLSESTQFPMYALLDEQDPFQKRVYDIKGKIPLYFKITFLHMSCIDIDVKFNSQEIKGTDFSNHNIKPGSSSSSGYGFSSGGGGGNKKTNNNKSPAAASYSGRTTKPTIQKYKPKSIERRIIFGSEHTSEANLHTGKGCTLVGNMRVPIVAGSLSLTLSRQAWSDALNYFMSRSRLNELQRENDPRKNDYNMTHYIHEIRFGRKAGGIGFGFGFGLDTASSGFVDPPLKNKLNKIENEMNGIALEQIQIKLIPTIHSNPGIIATLFGQGSRPYYQMSVVDHTIQPETMVNSGSSGGGSQPGIGLSYDVTPLAVHINEDFGDNGGFFNFLSTLIGIVGGCFVTISLFAGCAIQSIQTVAKKMD